MGGSTKRAWSGGYTRSTLCTSRQVRNIETCCGSALKHVRTVKSMGHLRRLVAALGSDGSGQQEPSLMSRSTQASSGATAMTACRCFRLAGPVRGVGSNPSPGVHCTGRTRRKTLSGDGRERNRRWQLLWAVRGAKAFIPGTDSRAVTDLVVIRFALSATVLDFAEEWNDHRTTRGSGG